MVDDHPVARRGICSYLDDADDFEVVAQSGDPKDLDELIQRHRPDILILDLNMGAAFDPIATVQRLQATFADLKIVIMSAHAEPRWGRLMHEASIDGYIHKTAQPYEVLMGLRAVMNGDRWFSRVVLQAMADHYFEESALNTQQTFIIQGVADGKTVVEIAGELGVSERTMRDYMQQIMGKLGVQSRAEAVAEAIRRGLIE
jgi:DNA-binding NarL/FixJ family response regulator